ncbi:MAG: substrate-binding domain-containing protein [Bacteroidales bacterium]|nr:substrate-binding domain-containing protein [Bacteroidales bacterium]
MAAQFFLRQHYTSYAFLGYKNVVWSEERMKGFFDALPDEHYHRSFLRVEKNHQDWNSVRKWLESLKKPTVMMVANDALGIPLIQTCKEIGLKSRDSSTSPTSAAYSKSTRECPHLPTERNGIKPSLHLQEEFLAIEESEEKPAKGKIACGQ